MDSWRRPNEWSRYAGWTDFAGLGLVFVLLSCWSWRKGPHPLVDFGRELYTPWQLAQGKVLYRDIESLFGPLSQYVNAAWFRLVGTSLIGLSLLNLTLIAVLAWLIYRIFRQSCGRTSGTLASLGFLSVFAFGQYNGIGNNNFVAPYAHEATHGIMLSVSLIYCFSRFVIDQRMRYVSLAGFFAGMTLLTKPEVSLAAVAVSICAFVMLWTLRDALHVRVGQALVIFCTTALLPAVGFTLFFARHMAIPDALVGVAGAWRFVFGSGITSNAYYRTIAGLDRPWENIFGMITALFALASVLGAIVWADFRWRRRQLSRRRLTIACLIAAILVLASIDVVPWLELARPLPVLSGGILAAAFMRVLRRRSSSEIERDFPLVLWACFSTVLLAKVVLRTTISHYGFYLAMPATLLMVGAMVDLVPKALRAEFRDNAGRVFRALVSTIAVALMLVFVIGSDRIYRLKDTSVGHGADRFRVLNPQVDQSGSGVVEALRYIERETDPNDTFVVLPEGVMLNYLARRENPLPYINFMPPELLAFGEDHILASLERSPPDLIILAHKDPSEYGLGFFGSDPRNGQRIMQWVDSNYESVETILSEPLRDRSFGIRILRAIPRGGAGL